IGAFSRPSRPPSGAMPAQGQAESEGEMANRQNGRKWSVGPMLLALARFGWGGTALAGRTLSSRTLRSARRPRSTRERLAMLPQAAAALREPVDIYWNDHQIPFVDARN